MAADQIRYTRLPGRLRGVFHTASLWLGDDHLLAVSGWRFSEDYKRFYYRDIQAVVVTRTPRGVLPVPWILAVVVASITCVIGYVRSIHWLGEASAEVLIVLALYLLVVSLMQSCRCRIQTAVSHAELPSLYRLWSARKALAILERRIGEVQGALAEGWMAHVAESPAGFAASQSGEAPAPPAPPPPRRSATPLELALYAGLAAGGGALLLPALSGFWTVVIVVQVLLGIAVLVDQHRRGGGARAARIVAVLTMALAGGIGYVDNLVSALQQVQAHPGQFTMSVRPADLSHLPVLKWIYVGGCLLLAVAGAFSALTRRKE
jgi:hypothetical protein